MKTRFLAPALAVTFLAFAGVQAVAAHAPGKLSNIQLASHRLDFSNAIVSVREDYTQTKWPVARRTFLLRGADQRAVSLPLADGGAGPDSLGLYKRENGEADAHGAFAEEYVLLGVHDCVSFDPVRVMTRRCPTRPPCEGARRAGLVYIGRYDWANGYDPPDGRFGFGWRFLSFEQGSENAFCPETRAR